MNAPPPPQLPAELQKDLQQIANSANGERLPIEDTGCYALNDEDAIRVYNKEGQSLFGLSHRAVSFESKPLFLFLQVYLMGLNTGRAIGQAEAKNKISELIKLAF